MTTVLARTHAQSADSLAPSRVRRWTVGVVSVAGVVALALLAARADGEAPGASTVLTTLDVSVGIAFVIAGASASGASRERLLLAAVGPAWLAGSVLPWARSSHQGVLLVALVAFPAGRLAGVPARLIAVGGAAVTLGVIPQLGVAALFAAACGRAGARARGLGAAGAYPVAASASVAAALVFSWWAVRNSSPAPPILVYEAVLLAVAVGFPLAVWALASARGRLADQVLNDVRSDGVRGLQLVLADVLSDPDLRVELVPVPRVRTDSPAIADGPTRAAVDEAVRLVAVNARLRDQQAQRLRDLQATRARLVAAADSERARIAHRLRTEAGAMLDMAVDSLPADAPSNEPAVVELMQLVRSELSAASQDLSRIAAGAPPVTLGQGRLHAALAGIAETSSTPVRLRLEEGTAAGSAVETALFYACSEALANAAKHSGATFVEVDLRRDGDHLVLSIRDDGRGGADASGSGLQGLADRMAAVGGYLVVASPAGQGTVVTAAVAEPAP